MDNRPLIILDYFTQENIIPILCYNKIHVQIVTYSLKNDGQPCTTDLLWLLEKNVCFRYFSGFKILPNFKICLKTIMWIFKNYAIIQFANEY